jgi:hypothetical protein
MMFSNKETTEKRLQNLEAKYETLNNQFKSYINEKQSEKQRQDQIEKERPVKYESLQTEIGPDLTGKTIFFRSIEIETQESHAQFFKPQSIKKTCKLIKSEEKKGGDVVGIGKNIFTQFGNVVTRPEDALLNNEVRVEDIEDMQNLLYVVRKIKINEVTYYLIFSKIQSSTDSKYILCMISYKDNKEDFIHLWFDTKFDINNREHSINKIVYVYTPIEGDIIYIGTDYNLSKTPIFSYTKIKDSVGFLTVSLVKIFNVKMDTILITGKLDPGFEPGHPYRNVIVINDIDRDWGQVANWWSGESIQVAFAFFTLGMTAVIQDNPKLKITLDDQKIIDMYVDSLVERKKNGKLLKQYGGKYTKRRNIQHRKRHTKKGI